MAGTATTLASRTTMADPCHSRVAVPLHPRKFGASPAPGRHTNPLASLGRRTRSCHLSAAIERISMHKLARGSITVLTLAAAGIAMQASSHREAPGITKTPKVDGTDFYMFRSYEAGSAGFVTLLANYQPLQDSYGGPNFFTSTRCGLRNPCRQHRRRPRGPDVPVPVPEHQQDLTVVGGRAVPVPLINVGGSGQVEMTPPI